MIGATTTTSSALVDVIVVVLSIVVAIVAYRVSETFKAVNGVTPWRVPSWGWAVIGLLSILICMILLAIARRTTKPVTTGGTAPGPGDLWASGNAVEAASTPAVEPAAPDPDAPPFGWYTDPSGQYQVRYWDGTRWTEHVASDGVPGIDFP